MPLQAYIDILKKQTELENLYDKLTTIHSQGTITIHPNLKDQLRAEATKQRDFSTSQILSRDLRSAAKSLKNHPDVIIRMADKSNIFVVLNKNDYKNKLDTILGDTNKFSKINPNPINTLKIEVNKLIAQINKQSNQKILKPITGEFSPGYVYGVLWKSIKTVTPSTPSSPKYRHLSMILPNTSIV